MAQDLKDGIIDRFRTLPMSGAAVLVGRTNGDLVINALSMLVMMGTGFIVGWRVNSSFLEFLAGVALLLLFAYAFSWVMAFLGMAVKSPEVINNASFLILFPLTFISNAFVPSENLPTPLRIFAEWNPGVVACSVGARTVRQRAARHSGGRRVDSSEPDRHRAHRRGRLAARVRAALDSQVRDALALTT